MFNSQFVCNVVAFTTNGEIKKDKHGNPNVMLKTLSGSVPNRTVLAGTIAKRSGIEIGKVYWMKCTETEFDEEYGRQFAYEVVQELSGLDAIKVAGDKPFGEANVFDSAEVAEAEEVKEVEAEVKGKKTAKADPLN